MQEWMPAWLSGPDDAATYRTFLERSFVARTAIGDWDHFARASTSRNIGSDITRHFSSLCTESNIGRWLRFIGETAGLQVPRRVANSIRSCFFGMPSGHKYRHLAEALRTSPDLLPGGKKFRHSGVRDKSSALGRILLPHGFQSRYFNTELFQTQLRVLELVSERDHLPYVKDRLGVRSSPLANSAGTLALETRRAIREVRDHMRPLGTAPAPAAPPQKLGKTSATKKNKAKLRASPAGRAAGQQKKQFSIPLRTNRPAAGKSQNVEVVKGAAVVIRKSSSPTLQKLIDLVRTIDLDVDTKFLASGLSVHDQWSIAFGIALAVRMGSTLYIVKAVDAEADELHLRLRFKLLDYSGPLPEVSYDLSRSERIVGRTWESLGAVILAYFFTDQKSLRRTGTRIDREILRIRFGAKRWSAMYVCAKDLRFADLTRSVNPAALPGTGRNRRPHETRSYFQLRRGKRVPISSYRTGVKRLK